MSGRAAAFDEVVSRRRSLRAFLPTEVDAATLEHIFSVAGRAPSNCNTQPWTVHVVSGELLATMRREMTAAYLAGELSLDFPYEGSYQGIYRERQHAAARALYDAVGIGRDDKTGRQRQFLRNFSFFDAPHVAFLFLPEPFGLREAADLGMFAQNLMLALTAHGLGSCPQTALGFHADYVRRKLGTEPGDKLLFGLSFGYPDPDSPVNRCLTERARVADFVSFHR